MATIVNIDSLVTLRIGEETLRFHCPGKQKRLDDGRWVVLNPVTRQAGIGESIPQALKNLREKNLGFFGSFEIGE
jgi:hypothetical protein